ncbi:cell division protein ZipA C-terminal FtsZ-binding domain-containing protein [Janthinobacterium sp. 17J80-10]|uniref:cell division protein ZipA C-terminal FtsZ-binding domain-containing protein n=1 Tax=Janthinobacterium sp. 17J80-10 TaxID=2497863 RepID=UPI0010056864|nr:cell division protein ZipA C-terminal FtsZ-binding domain-containing protein [Janthinobacterium sp. 17J80-10]QAU34636.1 cell division protein [Janthinobacterium sp. 17J80-10]
MTDLQTSLIAIGGAIVVGVISYNKWQEYKAKKNVERAFSSAPDDVLMQSGAGGHVAGQSRHEPSLDGEAVPGTGGVDTDSSADASAAAEAEASEEALRAAAAPVRDLPVDSLVDCPIPLVLETPAHGEKIILPLQGLRHVGNKPVHFIGQRNDGQWEPIAHRGVYTALLAGVQLANRGSALNELEYSELVTRLRQVADEINAEPEVPDMTAVMTAARSLHQFVAEYDAKLSVNVQSNGAPWAINTLLAALERQGFDLRPDGRLVMPDGDGGVLFSLSTNVTLAADTTSRLTLLLDVPCVSPQRDGFGAMIACAKALAARLGGTVVDDGSQPLSEDSLAEIARQVNAFYEDMQVAEIPAGSVRALRLFN